jgi:geranylgeranyl diphosphate synthase, type II
MYSATQLKELVEKALFAIPSSDEAPRLTEPVRYILSIGGKRLRPILALMACNLFSETVDSAVMPAAGIEVFHNFTLVHDDIMDKAPLRRNLSTVHTKWDLNQAILSGDVMSFAANECFLQAPADVFQKLFRVFNKAAVEVCEGQQLDIDFENLPVISEADYLNMIRLKTAVLIASSLKIGAILGKAPEEETEKLYVFGLNLGMAFQIEDDLLDIWGDAQVFGKTRGGDIAAGKKTLPFIKALEKASPQVRKELMTLYSGLDIDTGAKVDRIIEIYDSIEIRELCSAVAKEYNRKAFASLETVAVEASGKKELTDLASSLIGRVR